MDIISYQKTSTAKLEAIDGACFDDILKQEGGLSAYITRMEKDGEWGDGVAIITAAFAYERQIIIFHQNNTPILTCDEHMFANRDPIRLGYVNGNHYVSLNKRLSGNTGKSDMCYDNFSLIE